MLPPRECFQHGTSCRCAETISQLTIDDETLDSFGKALDISRRHEPRVAAVLEDFADLIQVGRHDSLPHRHVFEKLGRRTKKRRAIRIRYVGGHKDVAGGQIRWTGFLRDEAGERDNVVGSSFSDDPPDFGQSYPVAD